MDWELVKPWVNRVGIVLEFLSFWLAAPEVVTEIRQDEGEWLRALERRVERGIRLLPDVVVWVMLALGVTLEWVWELGWKLRLGLVIVTAGALAARWVETTVVRSLLGRLADDKRIRQRSLAVGAVLFVVGFLLQLIATF